MRAKCPDCQTAFDVPTGQPGASVSCPGCGKQFRFRKRKPGTTTPPDSLQSSSAVEADSPSRAHHSAAPGNPNQSLIYAIGVSTAIVLAAVAFLVGRMGADDSAPKITAIDQTVIDQQDAVSQPEPLREPTPAVTQPTPSNTSPPDQQAVTTIPAATVGSVANVPAQPAAAVQPQAAANVQTPARSPDQLFKDVAPAVVQIEMLNAAGKVAGTGTGFFIEPKGTLVTNAHVIQVPGAVFASVRLSDDSKLIIDEVQAIDDEADLAILHVRGAPNAMLELRDVPPKIGETAFAVGNPAGLRHTFSQGIVSGLRPVKNFDVVQTTAAIGPGSSGGPLMDAEGKVLGVVTLMITQGQNLNFAMPAEQIRALIANKLRRTIADIDSDENAKLSTEESALGFSQFEGATLVTDQDSLAGFSEVDVLVADLHADGIFAGLSKIELEELARRRLTLSGIGTSEKAVCYLYLGVSTIANSDRSVYGYVVQLDFRQMVMLNDFRPKRYIFASTWSASNVFGSSSRQNLKTTIGETVDSLMREFCADFKAANQ